MSCGIYQIRNVLNGKVYIGSSQDFEKRALCHKSRLRRGVHHSRSLQGAWDKYGQDSFVFELVEQCSKETLCLREQHWIDFLDSYHKGYNGRPIAESNRGCPRTPRTTPVSDETRAKIRIARAKQIITKEHAEKVGAAHRGIPLTEEHKAKLRKPKDNGRTGVKLSDETRKKMSDSAKKIKHTRKELSPTKLCKACGETKVRGYFYNHPYRGEIIPGGSNICKACETLRSRQRRADAKVKKGLSPEKIYSPY